MGTRRAIVNKAMKDEEFRTRLMKDPKAAIKLLGAGEFPVNERLDPSELAAYTLISSLILNSDGVITKE